LAERGRTPIRSSPQHSAGGAAKSARIARASMARRGAGRRRVAGAAVVFFAFVAILALRPGTLPAATPDDPAGVPFVTYAQARAAGDYRLACRQLASRTLLRLTTPPQRSIAAARTLCRRALRVGADDMTPAERAELAGTQVVKVRVKPGRARVTVQTVIYGVAPRATGTAVIEDGPWRIREIPMGAHVGTSLLLRVPSSGMSPTLRPRDLILADQSAYRHADPQIDEIVAFYPPAGAENNSCAARPPAGQACAVAAVRLFKPRLFVKRIVGRPGDRLSIRNGRVVRNGRLANEGFITPCATLAGCNFPRAFALPAGSYYVLGDNRGDSDDSRFWGPIKAKSIVGKVQRLGP
jgi:signal peptidase I